MSTRTVAGLVAGTLLFALSGVPHSLHTDVCSPYAARLGVNPGPPTPEIPHGIVACDDFSVTAIGDAAFGLLTLVLCIVGSVLLVRVAGLRSIPGVIAIGVAGALLGCFASFLYSGLGAGELFTDSGVRFTLAVAAVVAAIMAALEVRRLPNNSLERTREG